MAATSAAQGARTREPEVMEKEVSPSIPSTLEGTAFDVQVATAKRFPRSITTFIQRATEMATLTGEVAEACVYALPRDGKTIEGPSARLAEICANAWGNLRIQASATGGEDGRFVTGRGEAWDLEANVAIGYEVKRRITDKSGRTYKDDMIGVTGNAAASIALRNAVFKIIPAAFWKPIYNECRRVIAGDARTFAVRRDEMLKRFAVMGVTEQRLLDALQIKGKADITLDHMVTLTGYFNALKEGETTIEDAFPEAGGLGQVQPAQRKSQQASNGSAPETAQHTEKKPESEAAQQSATTNTAPAETSSTNPQIGTIAELKPVNNGKAMVVKLSTGYRCGTTNAEVIAALQQIQQSKTVVELLTRKSSTPGNADVLTEIQPVTEAATA